MKLAFIDTEFTGEHAYTTLISLGIVGMDDESLSLSINEYDRDQVTPWLEENVLCYIDESLSVSRREAFEHVSRWFEEYSAGELVSLVSAGKSVDLLLLFELWHFGFPELKYFHHLHCLPPYLNHRAHLDLDTIFFLAGVDPDVDREEFIDHSVSGKRHEALYDARVVRECFLKCMTAANFPTPSAVSLTERLAEIAAVGGSAGRGASWVCPATVVDFLQTRRGR
jgi:DNA polymerase III epsilon subunit-like protein